ncbi:Tat pathway signal protein [Streptomyces shenzhenensis]|uniref:Tat pathway signal protein n=1 Tax=Streptomyces shenzhenensis TaxID=943815 RepID=UPI0015EFE421|nr:Tat pathway signal protein [Streptomyces shenzhenensis]
MSESMQRRHVLKVAAGTAVASGWLWQPAPARAAETCLAEGARGGESQAAFDSVVFGDPESERAHTVQAELSDVVSGGLGQKARILNPKETPGVFGGTLSLTMRCRPRGATYVTIKLWGSDVGEDLGRLQLFAEGKQVGHYHLGAVDPLDIADREPRTPGRFYFHTLPLPQELTVGRATVNLEIRAMGRIGVYGSTPGTYYHDLTNPTRGIYRLYTHDEPYFDLPGCDVTGGIGTPQSRTTPGAEVLDAIKTRVAEQVDAEVNRSGVQGSPQYLDFLVRAYELPYTSACQNPAVPLQMVASTDDLYWRYVADPVKVIQNGPDWLMGIGRYGRLMLQLEKELKPFLDEPVIGSPGTLPNPGFEFGVTWPTGWRSVTWAGSGSMSRDTTVSRNGRASAKLTVPSSGVVGWVPQARVAIGQGAYTYGAWVKTAGVTGGEGAYMDVLFLDADGKVVGNEVKCHAPGGTHDWEQVTTTLTTPATATQIEVQVRLQGPGTAWFDDLTLVPPSGVEDRPVIRRQAWADMMLASREYWRTKIPSYTNQTIICCLGLYLADRALELLGSKDAWGEEKARGYIYQCVGLAPYLGPEDAAGKPSKPWGSDYRVVSQKGISRELGYAGNYGELQAWLTMVYECVCVYGGVRDDVLRAHLIKMAKARSLFHYPALDADGYKTMRMEAVVGWRDPRYPGNRSYDQDVRSEGHPMQLATVIKDPDLIAYAHQMIDDHQVFSVLADANALNNSGQSYLNLVSVQRDYDYVTGVGGSGAVLPMTHGQPSFVFSDEENGVLAVKDGDDILYASLYWRARWGVNRLARIHHITADGVERSATVWQDVKYVPDGRAFAEPDWVNFEFAVSGGTPGGFPPPGDTLHQAFAGQTLPLAKAPDDVADLPPGTETPFAGRASFYRCEYGPYLIAMNASADCAYTLRTGGFGPSVNLANGKEFDAGAELVLEPRSTVVLRRR